MDEIGRNQHVSGYDNSSDVQVMSEGEIWVSSFDKTTNLSNQFLGRKGKSLAELIQIGIPIPAGFIISAQIQTSHHYLTQQLPAQIWKQILSEIQKIEDKMGKTFGFSSNPLLLSVRPNVSNFQSDTMRAILNIGLNDEILAGIPWDTRFALDSYRRLIQEFGSTVLGIDNWLFDEALNTVRKSHNTGLGAILGIVELPEIVSDFKGIVKNEYGHDFPQDCMEQLRQAITVFYNSVGNVSTEFNHDLPSTHHQVEVALIVQAMVFGNSNNNSGTGMLFTRNPVTGSKELYGSIVYNAQGNDIFSGSSKPVSITELESSLPQTYHELRHYCEALERHYGDMQEVEFTIEDGKVWILNSRPGKRNAQAAVKIAVALVQEGIAKKTSAIRQITPNQVSAQLHPRFSPIDQFRNRKSGFLIAKGLRASPGASVGKMVLDVSRALSLWRSDENIILVRPETTPDDLQGMLKSAGIVTQRGGITSHAAVVARSIGLPCIVGCMDISIDLDQRLVRTSNKVVREGDRISIDGTTGEIFLGELTMETPTLQANTDLTTLLTWADEISLQANETSSHSMEVWANADSPSDIEHARALGVRGIGLCRTEHMFLSHERLAIMRRVILADDEESQKEARKEFLVAQRDDLKSIFRAAASLPVNIRLIDPPMHEFLPSHEELLIEVAKLRENASDPAKLTSQQKLLNKLESVKEVNPMLGLRGVRLSIIHPEIVEAQLSAILEAANEIFGEGKMVDLGIMIPLVSHVNEIRLVKKILKDVKVRMASEGRHVTTYRLGVMIEVPRAALTANELASEVDFFSFGTNDLTQTAFALSRDDSESRFLTKYIAKGVLPSNPFQELDQEGVGKLINIAIGMAKEDHQSLVFGICGEHGGHPSSIAFCYNAGVNYVSCSPLRVPIARLATAQAALSKGLN